MATPSERAGRTLVTRVALSYRKRLLPDRQLLLGRLLQLLGEGLLPHGRESVFASSVCTLY